MAKISAFGTQLLRGALEIAQVEGISGPDLSLDTEDVTTHDSPNAWEEHVGTILRSGEVTLDLVFDPAEVTHRNQATGLIHDMISREEVTYSLVFPTVAPITWTFNALVTGFSPDAPHSGALRASASLKLTGEPTLA